MAALYRQEPIPSASAYARLKVQCPKPTDGASYCSYRYFYAMSDQIGASVSGLLFLRKKEGSWLKAVKQYTRHPVMLASLQIILIAPAGLLGARLLGFSPTTQIYTALETIAVNLCWVPPLVGWLRERKTRE
ncbi:hypothetical protein [Candidatus Methanoperedens nitratireducens]|uniref:Uncharacterized protein n=1 Tax=Candidatus Methanoperedens nitratireducens TaxID=1392998 RepID=A0A284VLV6_9EURY|nr:hypothetical protein [Candidatus Methanoperedens nitroreducens]SNQ60266.1 hypothetical protein MNV_1740011 [Candidatus Methanoperedens nitroreducens]